MKPTRGFVFGLLAILLAGVLVFGTAVAQDPFPGKPLATDRGEYFSASGACVTCHQQMTDESGADVSIGEAWRSTMMANAARDPYWQASVRIETLVHPALSAVIEDKCATCHMPLAASTVHVDGEHAPVLDAGFLNPDHDLHGLAMDGNSCTLCHQITDVNFGTAESFSGGYAIDDTLPQGERVIYSQFQSPPELVAQMRTASGFAPEQGLHVEQAELCATCHTLYTPYVDDNGEVAGVFPEQMPYLEWLQGDFSPDTPCQICHMPHPNGEVVTSITGGEPRGPFAMHNFVGGNVYMQDVFLNFGDEMDLTAGTENFSATKDRLLDQLAHRTANVSIQPVIHEGDRIRADVLIEPLTGHKFPAGFPSRRAFIHFVVTDADGNTLFESGEFDANGRILDDDHDTSADTDHVVFEPHYAVITADDQVQIYETVMVDVNGDVTNVLLRGAGYAKNNRLLPVGFDKTTASLDIAVKGRAYYDVDFVGGSDCVMYTFEVEDAPGPYTITAELYYQAISYNWAEKIRKYDSAESAAFLRYYDALPNTPVLVGSASVTVE